MATVTTPCACLYLALLTVILAEHQVHIVHMDLDAMPNSISGYQNWYSETLSSVADLPEIDPAATQNRPSKLLYTYSNAIHGFSAKLSSSELQKLEHCLGFISSTRDTQVTSDTTHTPDFLNLNPFSGAWPVSAYGTDVIIGLVDTGVWPESASYNDDAMTEIPSRWKGTCESGIEFNSSLCNKKLIGAKHFNKGLVANMPNVTIVMNSPRDTQGHGTHTSSTAAGTFVQGASYFGYASGTAVGMAPLARVAIYKAIWDDIAYASDIIAAIDQAIDDGVDVLSMSFGQDNLPLYKDPIAIATFAAVERGIVVTASAGNEGPSFMSLHNGIPWLITVAAGSVDRKFNGIATLGSRHTITGLSLYTGNSSTQTPLVSVDRCDNVTTLKQIGHKIILCTDTYTPVATQVYKVSIAQVAGAIFVYQDPDQDFSITTFPSIFVSLEQSSSILDYINRSSYPEASMQFRKTHLHTKPAPMVAAYSSRGPSTSCPNVMKPDLMAPGHRVLASWPRSLPAAMVSSNPLFGDFQIISGTSMACPHTAGIAALVKAAHPEWSPAAIRSAMMTTSHVLDNLENPIKDIGKSYAIASPLDMGSGLVNPNMALDPGLIYDTSTEDYVKLLCSMNYKMKQIKAITRSSTYNCSRKSADLNYPSFLAFFNANHSSPDARTVKKFHRTVTNMGYAKSTYYAKVTPLDGFNLTVMPRRLYFVEKNQMLTYTITIEGPSTMKETVVHGALTWVDGKGKYLVRSPIVATKLSSTPLSV